MFSSFCAGSPCLLVIASKVFKVFWDPVPLYEFKCEMFVERPRDMLFAHFEAVIHRDSFMLRLLVLAHL